MKLFYTTLLPTLILILCNPGVQAQSLEFSQVLNVEVMQTVGINTNPTSVPKDTTITVPASHVWKLEYIASGWSNSVSSGIFGTSPSHQVFLNGVQIFGQSTGTSSAFPLWLKAGTYDLRVLNNNSGTNSYTRYYNWMISAIEFEVVP